MSEIDWTFNGTWPWEPRWFDTADGRMHYIDEGPADGRPVVMVHGNPTWGYLYRNFVGPVVEAGHRAIVVDHLGFGRSDKPDDPALYTIECHCERLEALLDSLDLRGAIPVVQDWGGPIGLHWASKHPERVAGLFVMNTFAHALPEPIKLPMPFPLFRAPVTGELLVKGLDIFKRVFLFRAGVVHRDRIDETVKRAYRAPHRGWSERTPILVFPREIPTRPEDRVSKLMGETEARLTAAFTDEQVRIVWAMKDPAFTPQALEDLWLRCWPSAQVTRLENASHYLQEDAHELIVPELLEFAGR